MKIQAIKSTQIILFVVLSLHVFAQGPRLSYFYEPGTELPWASCHIHFENGSEQKIVFFPVINEKTNCPIGINNYSKDINIDKLLVFLSGAINQELCININDRILMFYDNSNDTTDATFATRSLEKRISYAIANKAAGIVIISGNNANRLYTVNLDTEIPAIIVTDKTALSIFESAGLEYGNIAGNRLNEKNLKLTELPVNLKLKIVGNFSSIETDKCKYKYLPNLLNEEEINQQTIINEKAIDFILGLFEELDFKWTKENIFYYSNYDSKIFYTGYRGIGFSCDAGVYNVFFSNGKNYGLSVHENTHSFLRKNSLTFSSFFDEGIARYAEAMATDKNLNNKKTFEFMTNEQLLPLEKMLDFKIGSNLKETEMGYPASGSFVEFLVEKYGLKIILRLNNEAKKPIPRKELISLEGEWLKWLRVKCGFE